MKKYSATTRGFYDTAIHTTMPDDVVEVSDETYVALFAAQQTGSIIQPGANGNPIVSPRPGPTLDDVKQALTIAVFDHMNTVAATKGYDSIYTAVSYADEPSVPKFQTEGRALRAWRSLVWARCYEVMAEVEAGTRPVPTASELIALLPAPPVLA